MHQVRRRYLPAGFWQGKRRHATPFTTAVWQAVTQGGGSRREAGVAGLA